MSETKNIKELSVQEKLRALYDLQLIDSRLMKSETQEVNYL